VTAKAPCSVIVTVPPYARYLEAAVGRSVVSGLRLNTVLPVRDDLERIVDGLRRRCGDRTLWIDLKCRQLRVAAAAYVPYAWLELSHPIEVDLPVPVLLNGGALQCTCTALDGDGRRLILEDLPPVPLGAGMSVNIRHPSLQVQGYLTDRDRSYIAASREVGHHHYMLSYVERTADIDALLDLDPDAHVLAKIESPRGLAWAATEFGQRRNVNLVAARGDLAVELDDPLALVGALDDLVALDPDAVAASRILESLLEAGATAPSCTDVMDLTLLRRMGYGAVLLGDELGFRSGPLQAALDVLERFAARG